MPPVRNIANLEKAAENRSRLLPGGRSLGSAPGLASESRFLLSTNGDEARIPRSIQHAYDQFVGEDPVRVESFEQELFNAELARSLYDLRIRAGLGQRELARRIGTMASVICRLEDAAYRGHSLAMFKRIAAALGKRLELRFVAGRSGERHNQRMRVK